MSDQTISWGIAPIGWRNDDVPEIGAGNTLSHLLSDIVVAGFEGTEVGGFFPEADVLNKELQLRGLRIAGQWFSSYIIRDGLEAAAAAFRKHCAFLREVRADIAVVSEQSHSIQSMPRSVFVDKPVFTDEEWAVLTEGLNHLGQIAIEHGLKLAYHHHMGTGVQTLEEVDRLMADTDPALVHLLYDTGHIHVSDGDCMELLSKHSSRIAHVHFKDVRPHVLSACRQENQSFIQSFLRGMFTVPGDGCIDYVPIYQFLQQQGYRGWIVVEAEQDPAVAHPLEYAIKARNYIDEQVLRVR